MRRWLGFLASWALLIVALAVCSIAVVAEAMNVREDRRFRRFEIVDELIEKNRSAALGALRAEGSERQAGIDSTTARLSNAETASRDFEDTDQTILVSTAENKVYVRRDRRIVFEAVCSTGKGTTLIDKGRTMVFSTPIGKFRIVSKEENPVWVPPDWHYVEEARKNDGETPASAAAPVLKVKGDTVVAIRNGVERELPPGTMILAGKSVIIPPVDVKQRRFDKVLGAYRLNLGDADIAALYAIANVGDEVVIY